MGGSSGISSSYSVGSTEGRTTVKDKVGDIDIATLEDSLISVKKQCAQRYEDKIILNRDKKMPAIEDLRSKVDALEQSVKKLAGDLGSCTGGNSSGNALNSKIGKIRTGADGAVSFSVNATAKPTSTDIKVVVSQEAKKDRIESTFSATSQNSAIGFSGNIVINNHIINITNDSTMNSISNAINELSDKINVTSSIDKLSDTSYVLTLKSSDFAKPINFLGTAGTDSTLLNDNGLKFMSLMTDPSTLTNSKDQLVSGYTAADPEATIAFSGNLVINNQTVTIASGTSTLNTIRDSINKLSSDTKVTATVVFNEEANEYSLELNATEIASPINLLGTAGAENGAPALLGANGLIFPPTMTSVSTLTESYDVLASGYKVVDPEARVGFSGTLVINGKELTVVEGVDTLTTIKENINSLIGANVTADIVTDDDGKSSLRLTATEMAAPISLFGARGIVATDSTLLSNKGLMMPSVRTDPNTLTNTADVLTSSYKVADRTAAVMFSGNLVINNQTITVTNGVSSLESIRDSINELTGANVTASIADNGDGTNSLVLTATEIASPINLFGTIGTSVSLQGPNGLQLPSENKTIDELVAKLSIDGRNYVRNSNKFADAGDEYNGITFIINSASTIIPTTVPTYLTIDYDRTQAMQAIEDLVTNYNAVVDTLNTHKKTQSDGITPDESAVLFGNDVLNNVQFLLSNINNISVSGGESENFSSIGDIGIKLNAYNVDTKSSAIDSKLNINKDEFQTVMLGDDFEKVIKLFSNYSSSTVPNFHAFKMPSTLPSAIAGRPITLTYQYNSATSDDSTFDANFNVPQPTKALGPEVAGQLVTLTFSLDDDGVTYLGRIQSPNIVDEGNNIIVGKATIAGNTLTFTDSVYDGLKVNFTGTHPTAGAPIVTTLTLPSFSATFSAEGQNDVIVENVQRELITAPSDSIYAGLTIGYSVVGNDSPLDMGDSIQTVLTLTQGIAINFDQVLLNATKKYNPSNNKEAPTSLFDLAIQRLIEANNSDQKQIESVTADANRMLDKLKPKMNQLYQASYRSQSVSLMLETQRALLFGG